LQNLIILRGLSGDSFQLIVLRLKLRDVFLEPLMVLFGDDLFNNFC
jgi:hypothetical protein